MTPTRVADGNMLSRLREVRDELVDESRDDFEGAALRFLGTFRDELVRINLGAYDTLPALLALEHALLRDNERDLLVACVSIRAWLTELRHGSVVES